MADTLICKIPGCHRPVMYKKLGVCQTHYQQQRRQEAADKNKAPVIPPDIIEKMAKARTTEDWQALGAALTPVMAGIMSGSVAASAAQVSLIKDIMNRAYGKPVATQMDKEVSTGIVLLPTLGTGEHTITCPKCTFDALMLLQDDSTKELGMKVLKELLERLLAINATPTLAG